jgi:hypothetical protein
MLIEIWEEQSKQIIGFIQHEHDTALAITIDGKTWSVDKQVINIRVRPGHFAHITVHYVVLPLHIISVVVESSAFLPRGKIDYIRNDNDPELKLTDTKH